MLRKKPKIAATQNWRELNFISPPVYAGLVHAASRYSCEQQMLLIGDHAVALAHGNPIMRAT